MILLAAPYPLLTTTTVLPDQQFNDSRAPVIAMDAKYSMTGVRRTYIRNPQLYRLKYDFALSRMKALELRAFIVSYFASKIQLTNGRGEIYLGNFTVNPFEFSPHERAGGWPGQEEVNVTLEFTGALVHAVASPAC